MIPLREVAKSDWKTYTYINSDKIVKMWELPDKKGTYIVLDDGWHGSTVTVKESIQDIFNLARYV